MDEETKFYEKIGLRIAKFREQNNMTQEILGQCVDLSRVSIVNIEKGRQKPSLFLLYTMADIFGVSLIAFFDDENSGVRSGQENITDKDYEDIASFMKSKN